MDSPRLLQAEIHNNYSAVSGTWDSYKSQIADLYSATGYAASGSSAFQDFSNHLMREYNTKIIKLNMGTGMLISPHDAGYRFTGIAFENFSPLSLFAASELGAWYDPSDLTTMFEDAGGVTPVHTPGNGTANSTVGSMLDKRNTTYSTYFLDNADAMTVNSNQAGFAFGTGDFTVEMWFWPTASSYTRYLYDSKNGVSSGAYLDISFTSSVITVQCGLTALVANKVLVSNQWHHIAVVRASGITKLYVNGVQTGSSVNDTTDYLNMTSRPIIGKYGFTTGYNIGGYLSNLRVVKGTAVYTSDFAVPTSPLTAISGTSLLTCGTSWSGNPTLTVSANSTKMAGVTPFVSAYSNYFDGTGDSLTIADSAALEPGSGNFTLEAWIYLTQTSGSLQTIASKTGNGFGPFLLSVNGTSLVYYCSSDGTTWNIASAVAGGTLTINSWNHVALVRNGNTITPYLNGVAGTSTTTSAILINNTGSFRIGANYNGTSTIEFIYGYVSNFRYVVGSAVYTSNFTVPSSPLTAITNTVLLTCGNDSYANNQYITIDGDTKPNLKNPFVTTRVYGNHLIQSTSTARPTLSARYNLLTYSEQFDNGAWGKTNVSVVADQTSAPNATTTADFIKESTTTTDHQISYNIGFLNASANCRFLVCAKAATRQYLALQLAFSNGANRYTVIFDLVNGVATTVNNPTSITNTSYSITSLSNGWYRCLIAGDGSGTTYGAIGLSDTATPATWTNGSPQYTGNGTSGLYVWGADLRFSNDGASLPIYQRIADANTYDSIGFPYYLNGDGVDDNLATFATADFTGTNAVSIFCGTRRNYGGGTANVIISNSNSGVSTNGSFSIGGANGFASPQSCYQTGSQGTVGQSVSLVRSTYPEPISHVVTGLLSIASPYVTLRLNGTQLATNTSSQGTGNYSNRTLALMRSESGTAFYFPGRVYSMIVRGATCTAKEITNTESWTNSKSKIY